MSKLKSFSPYPDTPHHKGPLFVVYASPGGWTYIHPEGRTLVLLTPNPSIDPLA